MNPTSLSDHERLASLVGGATAGFCVDLSVYPLDTIKTRLQSASHVVKPRTAGRLGLFAGLPAVILGSAPGAALFFVTYETAKKASMNAGAPLGMASMLSACAGDMGWRGLYRGYWSQLSRGLPFCLIQYPVWELLKRTMEQYNREHHQKDSFVALNPPGNEERVGSSLSKAQFAICGAVAGAIGGFFTTPMDVAKTRIMLAKVRSDSKFKYRFVASKKGTPLASGNVLISLKTIYREGGVSGLFAGLLPRVFIMSFGGAIFLGLYDITKHMWLDGLHHRERTAAFPPLSFLYNFYKLPPATGSISLWNRERESQVYAGATAGLCVDVVLYPIDTLKTRLQSASGNIFTSCGRLKLFAGLPMVLLGSAPASAVFFYFYEVAKELSQKNGLPMWASSMLGTAAADITSMVLWVPCENVKQSAQSRPFDSLRSIFRGYVQHEGFLGLYRGYVSTIVRDLPCALIQFPIWEALKTFFARRNHRRLLEQHHSQGNTEHQNLPPPSTANLTVFQFALCGFLSGAIAGTVTTPLDVAKTRIMLAEQDSALASGRISTALKLVYKESGVLGCFAGILPRIGLMSLGGGIFLGLYDITKAFWETTIESRSTKPKP
ncbi:unnamed protein product [Rodentolepis nana]|uniref:Mitochondrial carrier protein n=1 Tax=Rodentolepis nana TaxID=102285 RepID=A0A0R3T1Y7_RODNA|nr:unnamed protein product [Rodentolepis nana]